jgi:hypothetical protein
MAGNCSSNGKLDKAVDEAQTKGWIVADRKNDWKISYPSRKGR